MIFYNIIFQLHAELLSAFISRATVSFRWISPITYSFIYFSISKAVAFNDISSPHIC